MGFYLNKHRVTRCALIALCAVLSASVDGGVDGGVDTSDDAGVDGGVNVAVDAGADVSTDAGVVIDGGLIDAINDNADGGVPKIPEPTCDRYRIGRDALAPARDYNSSNWQGQASRYAAHVEQNGSVSVTKAGAADRPRRVVFPTPLAYATVVKDRLVFGLSTEYETYIYDLKKGGKPLKMDGLIGGPPVVSEDGSKLLWVERESSIVHFKDFETGAQSTTEISGIPALASQQGGMSAEFVASDSKIILHRPEQPFYVLDVTSLKAKKAQAKEIPVDKKYWRGYGGAFGGSLSGSSRYMQITTYASYSSSMAAPVGASDGGQDGGQDGGMGSDSTPQPDTKNRVIFLDRNSFSKVAELESSQSMSFAFGAKEPTVAYFDDGDKAWKVWTKQRGVQSVSYKVPPSATLGSMTLSSDGKYAALFNTPGSFSGKGPSYEVLELATNKIIPLPSHSDKGGVTYPYFISSASGQAFVTYFGSQPPPPPHLQYAFNISTGTELGPFPTWQRSIGISERGELFTSLWNPTVDWTDQKVLRLSKEFVCVKKGSIKIVSSATCATCPTPSLESKLPVQKQVPVTLDQVTRKHLCEKSYDEAAWEKFAPSDVIGELALERARAYLLRFQKPGGFNERKHIPILLALLESPEVTADRSGLQALLQNLASSSPVLFREVLGRFPELVKDPFPASLKDSCRSDADTKKLLAGANEYIEINLSSLSYKSTMADWKGLSLFTPLLSQLKKEKKEEQIDLIAQSLTDSAVTSPKYVGIFASKLYKFSYQAVAPYFGEKPKQLTDLTIVRQKDTATPYVLGMRSLEVTGEKGVADTTYGFSVLGLPPIAVPREKVDDPILFDKEISWSANDASYSAHVKISQLDFIKSIVPTEKTPRYDQLFADGALTGVVVAGSNLRGTTAQVLNDYRQYMVDKEFVFPDPPVKKTVKLKDFLKKGISDGSFDYLIKEAHSDGDEKNVFRMNSIADVETGVRTFVDPVTKKELKEIVHIVFPNKDETKKTELLKNEEFGKWIQAREKNEAPFNGQFVYFNTSCSSKTKAIHEVEAASTPAFLNIPTSSTTKVFLNQEKNAEYLLLTAFRAGSDFKGMREELSKNNDYKNKLGNTFLFPDDEEYKNSITDVVKFPLKVDLKILDSQGEEYNIDQDH